MPSSETPPPPHYPNQKQQRPLRKRKSDLENVPPPDRYLLSDSPFPTPSPSSRSAAAAKIRSPLPPRPPRPLKRKLSTDAALENDAAASSDSGVQIIVRIRPPNKVEEESEQIVQKVSSKSISILDHVFTFDSVANTDSTQRDIFELVGVPLVENCLAGFNSSIFAYGQTGSGKTYTMWGPPNAFVEENSSSNYQKGLTPRVFEQLFARIEEEKVKHADKHLHYQCRCSFLEIYNEQITDLLDPSQRNLQIREDVKSGVYVDNLTEEYVCTMKEINQLLIKGVANRRTGSTTINAESSRSHSVFTCVVEFRCKSMTDGLSSLRTSRINLVDLAGSERQKQTGVAGERLKEAGNINRSLSQLGNLINILAEVSQSGKQRHIPYRDSRLTFLLQESLGGNAKLAMICAVSPAQSSKSETLSTLRFAQRAKAIKNKAVVNEVTQDDVNVLRKVICELKEELIRIKSDGSSNDGNGGRSKGWNARRSLSLLRFSLNHPMTLPHVEDDSDEEMEIDEEDVERLCTEGGLDSAPSEEIKTYKMTKSNVSDTEMVPYELKSMEFSGSGSSHHDLERAGANKDGMPSDQRDKHVIADFHEQADGCGGNINKKDAICTSGGFVVEPVEEDMVLVSPECKFSNGEPGESVKRPSTCLDSQPVIGKFPDMVVANLPLMSPSSSLNSILPPSISFVTCELSPDLQSPTLSITAEVGNGSRKSLRTSSTFTASQKKVAESNTSGPEILNLSFAQPLRMSSSNALSTKTGFDSLMSTENLEASLHRGLEVIDSHQRNSPQRRSSFRFSLKPVDLKPLLPANKVDVGVQTLCLESDILEDMPVYMCNYCKTRIPEQECKEPNACAELSLVPVNGSLAIDKSKHLVPKAVKKVLAGAIRREMALEEFCARQAAEIIQLNRLVQQYKHERECNAIIEQTREDKICRLESLMDGVLPTEEFMGEEFVSLANEHKLLKEKYDNHPEVLMTKIEFKRVQDELDGYRNFFDLGERDVLMEEIQHLRSQLQLYVDSSPMSTRKRSPLLKLTYPSKATSLTTVPEFPEQKSEGKFEQARRQWTETESKWVSLTEELRLELEEVRSLAEKQKQELHSEKKCSEEFKEALQIAMQGHARILDQYAELQEKHIGLLAKHQKMRDGIEDVKRAAARAGVKGAESKFINSLAAEISALRMEKDKERRYLKDENKGLQSQLRDTAEAVQAASELLVRLKEAEEAAAAAQKRAVMAEQVAEKARQEIDELKKKHERERTNQLLAESDLSKEVSRPACSEVDMATKYDRGECDQQWGDKFVSFCDGGDNEFSRIEEPSSWFSGYDRCNI
ncbi:hypothetical protein MRB53_007958 [Persea americana]|uniref:Uncharacterized protein n=1 Tax=Persea americana TaxID=3435 RepID=A0ACC2MKF3_PERAE|nr:hypothetical protein MRB53_007958 [Persea americana]